MNTFTKTLLATVALATLAACGQAGQTAAPGGQAAAQGGALTPASLPGGQATFTDPTENAFTVSVPAGWTVKGGVDRMSPVVATLWVQATSPDGATTISLGDPSVRPFTLPSYQHPEGSTVVNAAGVQTQVASYESAVQFGGEYAQRTFGQQCAGLQPSSSQPDPNLAQEAQAASAKLAAAVGVPPPSIQYDSADNQFSCQVNGAAYVVEVMDVTSLQQLNGGGGWGAPALISYRTPAASAAQTQQIAMQMHTSLQHNPDWDSRMDDAEKQALAQLQQQGLAAQQQLASMQASQNAMLNANEAAANARLNAGHAAFMQQFNAQGAARNAAWNQQMYDKETNHQAEMRNIRDQTCIAWYDAAHTRCSATAQY